MTYAQQISESAFIGLRTPEAVDGNLWEDGTPLTYSNLPLRFDLGFCVATGDRSKDKTSSQWRDVGCHKKKPFFCKIKLQRCAEGAWMHEDGEDFCVPL